MLWNCINVFTKQFLPKENHCTWATDTTASNSYRFIRKRPWIPRSELEVNLSKLCLMVNQTLTVVELQTRCRILMFLLYVAYLNIAHRLIDLKIHFTRRNICIVLYINICTGLRKNKCSSFDYLSRMGFW